MKKYYFIFMMLPLLMFSCLTDDSTYGTDSVKLEVNGIEDNYIVVSYSGDFLTITPQINTTFDESDLEYSWDYYDNARTSPTTYSHTNEATHLEDSKDLNFLVNLPDGTYTLIFKVTSKSTGVSTIKTATVSAASALSKGFFILKEDSQGNTDLDLYNQINDIFSENVVSSYQGAAIPGKPRHLDVNIDMAYLDPDTESANFGNLLSVTTENDEVRWIRALDCRTVMDATNCHYDPTTGEIPYRTIHGYQNTFYLTNNGVYYAAHGNQGGIGTLGMLVGNGGSTHAVGFLYSMLGPIFWNNQTRSIDYVNYTGVYMQAASAVPGYATVNTNYNCLSCGYCDAALLSYFILEDKDNPAKRYIYVIQTIIFTMDPTLVAVIEIQPDSHFAKATEFASNSQSAAVIYGVDNNKVYSFGLLGTTPEKELTFEGLPSNETITYISNRYFSGYTDGNNFDHLIIGTQSGNNYKLYMYNMVGGEPVGAPVHVVSGTGKVHSVDYITPSVASPFVYPILDK